MVGDPVLDGANELVGATRDHQVDVLVLRRRGPLRTSHGARGTRPRSVGARSGASVGAGQRVQGGLEEVNTCCLFICSQTQADRCVIRRIEFYMDHPILQPDLPSLQIQSDPDPNLVLKNSSLSH